MHSCRLTVQDDSCLKCEWNHKTYHHISSYHLQSTQDYKSSRTNLLCLHKRPLCDNCNYSTSIRPRLQLKTNSTISQICKLYKRSFKTIHFSYSPFSRKNSLSNTFNITFFLPSTLTYPFQGYVLAQACQLYNCV